MGVAPSTSSEAPAEAVWPSDWHKIPGKSRKIARAAILDISVRCGHHPLTRMRLARAHHSHLPGVTIVVRLALGARALETSSSQPPADMEDGSRSCTWIVKPFCGE